MNQLFMEDQIEGIEDIDSSNMALLKVRKLQGESDRKKKRVGGRNGVVEGIGCPSTMQ